MPLFDPRLMIRRISSGRHHRLIVAMTLTAIAVAACSGGGASVPTSGAANPPAAAKPTVAGPAATSNGGAANADASCGLVTAADVAQATGFSIATASGAGGTCIYQNADPSKFLAVQLFSTQAAMALMLQLESSGEHIAGLGDDAYWQSSAGYLFVRKGDRGMQLLNPAFTLTAPTDTAPRDALVKLARTAVDKL